MVRRFFLIFVVTVLVGPTCWGLRVRDTVIPGEVVVRASQPVTLTTSKSKSPEDAPFFEALNLLPAEAVPLKREKTSGVTDLEEYLFLLRGDTSISSTDLTTAARKLPGVIEAEPNYRGTVSYIPTDPTYSYTADHFASIGLENAWNIQQGGSSSVTVAVIDSGIDPNHFDLDGALAPASYNFVAMNSTMTDDLGHGTRVAGIIAAEGNNGTGIAGIAFGAKILSLDVVDASGVVTTARIIPAIKYAVDHGAQVINMSLQFYAPSQLLEEACEKASEHAVLVASAGNENQGETPVYPASYDSVIGVGATEIGNDTRAPFSNYNGTETTLVDLIAPGVNIFTTIPGSVYDGLYTNGTSFAAPMVSGVAALLQSHYPSQSPQGIFNQLKKTATPVASGLGWNKIWGRLSAEDALKIPLLPQLTVASVSIDDSTKVNASNDPDGAWDKGDTVLVTVSLANTGGDATGVTGTVTTTDADVTITDDTTAWPEIKTGETAASSETMTFTASVASLAHEASFTLNVSGNTGIYIASLPFTVRIENTQKVSAGIHIDSDPVLWTADKTWEVHGSQIFYHGLTVEAGTVIKMAPDADITINNGSFIAHGTQEKPILFTSLDSSDEIYSNPDGPKNEPINVADYNQIRYISIETGSDITGNGTKENPWATIDHALLMISNASKTNRHALFIAKGHYTGETIVLNGWIDIFGGFEPFGWTRDIKKNKTILDGQNERQVISSYDHARVDGFTIINGKFRHGGGIAAPLAEISNNIFYGNNATEYYGGAIYAHGTCFTPDGKTTIRNNLIFNNTASWRGGGIFTLGDADVQNNIIFNNYSVNGGGIYTEGKSTIYNNLLVGNTASYGGGIHCQNANCMICSNVIYHNTVYHNTVTNGSGGGIQSSFPTSTEIINTIIWENYADSERNQIDGIPTVSYSDIQGGWTGEENLDMDPGFINAVAFGQVISIVNDSTHTQSTILSSSPTLIPGSLVDHFIDIDSKYYYIISNTTDTITIEGVATIELRNNLPVYWQVNNFHIRMTSPLCRQGIGPSLNANVPLSDIDGDMRSGDICDIGIDEYNSATQLNATYYGNILIKLSSVKSSFSYCTFENGAGVIDEAGTTLFDHCSFNHNTDCGLYSSINSSVIQNCSSVDNLNGGFFSKSSTFTNCCAISNGGAGFLGKSFSKCISKNNLGNGINGISAFDSIAENNDGAGFICSDYVQNSTATNNRGIGIEGNAIRSASIQNDGAGIIGTVNSSIVISNHGGGVVGNVNDTLISSNEGPGVSGNGSLVRCDIRYNSGTEATQASGVVGSILAENGFSITCDGVVSESYISGNSGDGVTKGKIISSSIIWNLGRGLRNPTSVKDSLILGNRGIGIDSPSENVELCTIRGNQGVGIKNINTNFSVNESNLFDNDIYDYYDDSYDNTTGAYKNLQRNHWGRVTSTQMASHPFPFNIGRIYDQFDNLYSSGWLADYNDFSTSLVPNAPSAAAPAILLDVTPNLENAVNVGLAVFTLVFSETMDLTVAPAVTFGLTSPYTDHVVAVQGWMSSTTWRGTFAVGIKTGDGLNTLRVTGAKAADGFVIPDDTFHQFNIDTRPGTGANRGEAIPLSESEMQISWSPSEDVTLFGFCILRARNMYEEMTTVKSVLPSVTSTIDTNLTPNTTYYYQVLEINDSKDGKDYTSLFQGTTFAAGAPTLTPTPTPAITPTPTPTVTPDGDPTPTPTEASSWVKDWLWPE